MVASCLQRSNKNGLVSYGICMSQWFQISQRIIEGVQCVGEVTASILDCCAWDRPGNIPTRNSSEKIIEPVSVNKLGGYADETKRMNKFWKMSLLMFFKVHQLILWFWSNL